MGEDDSGSDGGVRTQRWKNNFEEQHFGPMPTQIKKQARKHVMLACFFIQQTDSHLNCATFARHVKGLAILENSNNWKTVFLSIECGKMKDVLLTFHLVIQFRSLAHGEYQPSSGQVFLLLLLFPKTVFTDTNKCLFSR